MPRAAAPRWWTRPTTWAAGPRSTAPASCSAASATSTPDAAHDGRPTRLRARRPRSPGPRDRHLPAVSEPFEGIRFERLGAVLRVTIANPRSQLNTGDGAMRAELDRLFRELRQESEARAVVLTGSGRAFSAGGDFGWFKEISGAEAIDRVRRDGKQIIWDLLDVEVPIVAAVN